MKRHHCAIALLIALVCVQTTPAFAADGFDVVVLGSGGGIDDGNLSSYLVRPHGDGRYVACDAGTLVHGIQVAAQHGAFADVKVPAGSADSLTGYILKHEIGAYLISHAHFDHIAGLVIASPDDSAKRIYALPSVIDVIESNVFNWKTWPDFGNEGVPPTLNTYTLERLPVNTPVTITGTAISVDAFPLSHGGIESTAFLLESGANAMLYFGDTGADALEHSTHLHDVWVAASQRLRRHQLTGMIIEVSYTDAQPDGQLFGHLTPRRLLSSLHEFETVAGGAGSLNGLTVLVAHVKYSLASGPQPQAEILRELQAHNDLGVRFVIARQGMHLQLPALVQSVSP